MRRVLSLSLVMTTAFATLTGAAKAEKRDDLCEAPKQMKTDKWQPRSEVGGMSILIPPGFSASGIGRGLETSGAHYYINGEHRTLVIGFGPGIQSILHDPTVMEKGECETDINGQHVNITLYSWVNEDPNFSATGDAGARFAAVARFYSSGRHREEFVAFVSNVGSELKLFKQIYWTVSFDGPQDVAAAAPKTSTPAAPVSNVASAAPTNSVVVGQVCSTAPPPANLPAASTVVDSAVVGTLLAGAAPIPAGFEVMRLQFDEGGELAGMNVSQTDLPEASQRELAAVVGTNLKPHDKKTLPSIYLRIDSSATGLRYSVVPPPSC